MIGLISIGTGPASAVAVAAGLIIFCIPACYLLSSLLIKRFVAVDFYVLALYMSTAFFIASFAEPLGDMVYRYFAGSYLWSYQFLPIFGGASTAVGFMTWPFYGYYCYFLHQIFHSKGWDMPAWKIGTVSAIDGIPFDMVGNFFTLVVFGSIFFYYPSPELWHLSALWVIPIYLAYGIVVAYLLQYLFTVKRTLLIPLLLYLGGLIIMFTGDALFTHF